MIPIIILMKMMCIYTPYKVIVNCNGLNMLMERKHFELGYFDRGDEIVDFTIKDSKFKDMMDITHSHKYIGNSHC